ncbi:MAG: hypothetical protein CMP23_02665 [Rickettsiales bacterium]|nr:hypothetical protein [Rickettsiales bacterium]
MMANRTLLLGTLILGFVACRNSGQEAPPQEQLGAVELEAQPAALPPDPEQRLETAAVEVAAAVAPLIEYLPEGLSPLYQGFFADPQAIAGLRAGLAGQFSSPVATLKVIWDPSLQQGTITLHLPESERGFESLADAVLAGEPLPMAGVAPLFAAVGDYRADLGARFDLRLLSFGIRLSWWDPRSGSHCVLGGVLNDPEGRVMAPCFSCPRAAGEPLEVCRTEDGSDGSDQARQALARALRSDL